MVELTAKQEKYILNIVDGMSQRQAYMDAYDVKTEDVDSIDQMACRLFNDIKVRSRYIELLEEQKNRFLMTSVEKRKKLTEIIHKSDKVDDVMKAIDLDNKMAGVYVDKHQVAVANPEDFWNDAEI